MTTPVRIIRIEDRDDELLLETSAAGETAVRRYLAVVNDALDEARDSLLLGIDAWFTDAILDGTELAIGIYDDDEDDVEAWFTVDYDDEVFTLVGRGKDDPDYKWKVSRSHVAEVIGDPDHYVDHPGELMLDAFDAWLV